LANKLIDLLIDIAPIKQSSEALAAEEMTIWQWLM